MQRDGYYYSLSLSVVGNGTAETQHWFTVAGKGTDDHGSSAVSEYGQFLGQEACGERERYHVDGKGMGWTKNIVI